MTLLAEALIINNTIKEPIVKHEAIPQCNYFFFQSRLAEFKEAERCMYISPVNQAIIGSDNGLSPVQNQTIIWTNNDLLSAWH